MLAPHPRDYLVINLRLDTLRLLGAAAWGMRRSLPWTFWAALAFTFVMAALPHPPRIPGDPIDKV